MTKTEELSIWADCNDGHTFIAGNDSDQITVGKVMKMVGTYHYTDCSGKLNVVDHVEVPYDVGD